MSVEKILKCTVIAGVIAVCSVASAQDEMFQAASSAEGSGVAEEKAVDAVMYPAIKCVDFMGEAEVLSPVISAKDGVKASEWKKVERGRYYSLGSSFRTLASDPNGIGAKPSLSLDLGPLSSITVKDVAQFSVRSITLGDKKRTIVLNSGVINVKVPVDCNPDQFKVVAPFFLVSKLAGESSYKYGTIDTGDEAEITVITGHVAINGAHYSIAKMSAADKISIRTTGEDQQTFLRGISGDYPIVLDQGIEQLTDFATGVKREEPASFTFNLSPLCTIKIFRRPSSVDGKKVVSTMVLDAAGRRISERAFTEGRYNVNSGELVVKAADLDAEDGATASESAASETTKMDVNAAEEKPAEKKEEAAAASSDDADL